MIQNCYVTFLLYAALEWLAFLFRSVELPGSVFGPETGYNVCSLS